MVTLTIFIKSEMLPKNNCKLSRKNIQCERLNNRHDKSNNLMSDNLLAPDNNYGIKILDTGLLV